MTKLKEVLLIEDDPVASLLTRNLLENHGMTECLICRNNGRDALQYLLETCWVANELLVEECADLILLDINLPMMNGFELLKALQERGADELIRSRVVVLSSSTNERDKKMAEAFGVKGYLLKPFTIAQLQGLL